MEHEDRPVRYPTPSVSASGVCRTDDPALAENSPVSSRQPPPYGDERAPPQYQEEAAGETKTKAKARRTTFVRLLTSIFVTVLVSLIVAAVVGRIHDGQSQDKTDNNSSQQAVTESMERFTMMSSEATALSNKTETTSSTVDPSATTTGFRSSHPPTTTSPLTSIDCASMAHLTSATPVTTMPSLDITSNDGDLFPSAHKRDGTMLGAAMYSSSGCLWAQASYGLGNDDEMRFRCGMSCPERHRAAGRK